MRMSYLDNIEKKQGEIEGVPGRRAAKYKTKESPRADHIESWRE